MPLRQLLQTRRALEEGLISEVAKVITDEDLQLLDELVEQDARTTPTTAGCPPTWTRPFTRRCSRRSDNPFVLQLIDVFWTIFRKAADHIVLDLRRPTAEDHAAIVDALRSGDRAAMTKAVARHFEDLQRSLDAHPA